MSVETDPQETRSSPLVQQLLDNFVRGNSDIRGGVISTVDGFEIASSIDASLSAGKLSAMTSSLLALSEAISRESGLGSSRDMVIDAERGRVLLREVLTVDARWLLTVLCDNAVMLGQVLWAVNAFRNELGAVSDG